MKPALTRLLVACALLISSGTVQATASIRLDRSAALSAEFGAHDWIVKAENNICGLSDATQLSNPVVVDFAALLEVTPEYKKMKDQKISPTSPEGIKLNNDAVNRIATQCESVRASNGYCSVWKEIKHRDGRAITDVTDKVKALL